MWWCLWITGGVLWFVIGFQYVNAKNETLALSSDACSREALNLSNAARPQEEQQVIAKNGSGDTRQTSGEESRSSAPGSIVKHPTKKKSSLDTCVNLNSATPQELIALEGIGTVIAERIITYREEKGPFKEPQELMNVKGIGQKKFEKIRAHICLLP